MIDDGLVRTKKFTKNNQIKNCNMAFVYFLKIELFLIFYLLLVQSIILYY
jgi:hypothetical protein